MAKEALYFSNDYLSEKKSTHQLPQTVCFTLALLHRYLKNLLLFAVYLEREHAIRL
jgi:hypothetical protein